MVKQTTVHPYQGILFSNKKEQTIDTCNNLDGSQGIMMRKKNVNLKRPHIV